MSLGQMHDKVDNIKIDRDKFVFLGLKAFFVFLILSVVNAFFGAITDAVAWGAVGFGLLVIAMIPAAIFHRKYKKAFNEYGDALDKFFKVAAK